MNQVRKVLFKVTFMLLATIGIGIAAVFWTQKTYGNDPNTLVYLCMFLGFMAILLRVFVNKQLRQLQLSNENSGNTTPEQTKKMNSWRKRQNFFLIAIVLIVVLLAVQECRRKSDVDKLQDMPQSGMVLPE